MKYTLMVIQTNCQNRAFKIVNLPSEGHDVWTYVPTSRGLEETVREYLQSHNLGTLASIAPVRGGMDFNDYEIEIEK